eukprot:jgi/Chlat1/6332/Chrsp44S05897
MERLRDHMGTMEVSRTTFKELAKRVIVYKHALTANELQALGECRSELMRRLGLGFAGTSVLGYYLLGSRMMPIRLNRFLRAAAAGFVAMPVGLNYAAGAHLNCLQGVLAIPDSKLAGEARCILQELFPENAHARALQQAVEARHANNNNSSPSSGLDINLGGGGDVATGDGNSIKRIVPPHDAMLLQTGHTLEGVFREKLKAREEQARARGVDGDLDRSARVGMNEQRQREQQQGSGESVMNKEVLEGLLRERMMAERQRRQDSEASTGVADQPANDFFGLSNEGPASSSDIDMDSASDGEGGGEAASRRDRWRRRHRHREQRDRPPPSPITADDPEMT